MGTCGRSRGIHNWSSPINEAALPARGWGCGLDDYTAEAIGLPAFRSDNPELGGLDDRHMSRGVMEKAQQLAALDRVVHAVLQTGERLGHTGRFSPDSIS